MSSHTVETEENHSVPALKRPNKPRDISWQNAVYSQKNDLRYFKPPHPPLITQYHINTVDVSRFLETIFHMLQDQSKRYQIP